ncbi:hypothetical protein HMPREF3034_00257 [Prevotella sp. DNF00663]|nr:hypothetical protein HMPREF3034_00257 [Prevotella sp. DNF00663]
MTTDCRNLHGIAAMQEQHCCSAYAASQKSPCNITDKPLQ